VCTSQNQTTPIVYHKRIRLPLSAYLVLGAVFSLTIGTRARKPVFGDPTAAEGAIEVLTSLASERAVTVYGYCIMPDHIHLVVSMPPAFEVLTFVGQFKNLTQRAVWQLGVAGAFWQKSFWDHAIRSDESLEETVWYVLNNPVRRGLASIWTEYPFAGSLAWDLRLQVATETHPPGD